MIIAMEPVWMSNTMPVLRDLQKLIVAVISASCTCCYFVDG
jgi:hypothetical protein